MSIVYYGQTKCQHSGCNNGAYYCIGGKDYRCGVHSRKNKDDRTTLPKMEASKARQLRQEKQEQHLSTIKQQMAVNVENGQLGQVSCYKMKMIKQVPLEDGILNILPNYKSKGRSDGIAVPSLSPMVMGPIEHSQPGLPPAKNLENFWQSSKVFADEYDEKTDTVRKSFFTTQRKLFLDDIPHRHKRKGEKPLFWLWKREDGTENRLSYVEARQFYCNYYERFALSNPKFRCLQKLLKLGANIRICGYDAYEPTLSLEKHYLDASKPFGHELMLYSLLTLKSVNEYPWRRHKTENF